MVRQSISPSVRKTPPGPRGYPIIGCLPQMMGNRFQFLNDVARQYGDIVHLGKIGPQQLYLVTHPDYLKHILQENPHNYTKGANFKNKDFTIVVGNGLVNSEGDLWRRQRRLMQPAFHRQRVAAMVTSMTTVITEMLESWRGIEENAPIEVSTQMLELTQKIVLKALLSIEPSSRDAAEVIKAWNTVFAFHRERAWAFIKLPLSIPTPKHRRFLQAVHTLDAIANRIIRERQQGGNHPDDMLSMLLSAHDESGEGMSDQQLRDEVVGLFAAGFETSGTSLGWIWYLISQHPSVEQKLYEELDAVLGGRTPTFDDLPNLKYTKMAIEEAMRLYPSVWINSRTNLTEDEIGGYHIPAQSLIVLSPFVTHRHPTFWENPEQFDPDRFLLERSATRPRWAYFPFGGGPRQCIGEVLAMTEMQLIVAMVAQNFRLRLVPEHPVEKRTILTLEARHGILMKLESRTGLGDADQLDSQKQLSHR